MSRTVILKPISPTKEPPTPGAGKYGADRWYGKHKGKDYKARWGSDVYATEGGVVVFSSMIEGSEKKTKYGNTVVIDHTPSAGKNERHIYTLSAHLNVRNVSKGQEVRKKDVIGKSGNSGTREYYKGKKKGTKRGKEGGFHLHFEVIDSPHALQWAKGNFSPGQRKSPIDFYIGHIISIEYPVSDDVKSKIEDRLSYKYVIHAVRKTWRIDVSLDGTLIGRIDKDHSTIRTKMRI